jgi:hypothetical protein
VGEPLLFLLGSGISRSAGYPGIEQITERVLSGSEVFRFTDETFRLGIDPRAQFSLSGSDVRHAVSLLRLLMTVSERAARGAGRKPNYEDLYYLVRQLADFSTGELDNPAIGPLEEVAHAALPHLFESKSLRPIAAVTADYVADVAWHLLDRIADSFATIRSLTQAIADDRIDEFDFFTLNHDSLLEQTLRSTQRSVVDGFGPEQNGVRYWDSSFFDEADVSVRLFKLHGSIDWWRFRRSEEAEMDFVGIPIAGDPEHTVGPNGTQQTLAESRPLLLIGTFNKVFDYSHGIWSELHCRFGSSLTRSRRLVIAGYGFGDKGINARIAEWMSADSSRKIVVVDPSADPSQYARPAIRMKWKPWQQSGRLHHFQRGVEQTDWPEIAERLT